ncbi:aminotransferase-like domain-containing protein [Paenibacillus wenxiniae]|uniref:PLP-dependent aminotransferase family protein n=1 Tax=Paenibacillus wenxiniae TaxID=1636843 RepID=A0ABW4RIX0_9BACL
MPINSFDNYPMSWKPRIDRASKPIYKALATQLEQDIMNGQLLPGTKLPPQRELADYLDLNLSTISKAFKVCELKGLLSAAVGSGTFVSYDALSNAYLLDDQKPRHVIEMGATLPDHASYEPLMQQLKSMLHDSDYARWFGYGRSGETLWQKDAAVQLMRRGGFETTVEHIVFANGAQNAIAATLAALCKPGDRIGVDQHTYPGVKTVASLLSIQTVPIRSEDGVMSPEALEYACKNENINGIYVIPDYHNPTASFMPIALRRHIADIAIQHHLFVIEDASYHLLDTHPLPALASFAPEQVIHIAGLSKALAPGLRLAYVSVPTRFREALSKALYNLNVTVSPLLAELAARIVVSHQLETLIDGHRQQTILRNEVVDRYLADYHCAGAPTGIFRWLLLPEGITGADFERFAAAQGVQIYAAERFVVGNSTPERAVRLAVCAPETLEQLEQGLVILKRLLDEIKDGTIPVL